MPRAAVVVESQSALHNVPGNCAAHQSSEKHQPEGEASALRVDRASSGPSFAITPQAAQTARVRNGSSRCCWTCLEERAIPEGSHERKKTVKSERNSLGA